ncbi:MAG: hypothetical protein QW767_03215 [Thermoprotei archaeon]
MQLQEMYDQLSDEELAQRIKTLERQALVAEQDFYEKRNAYKKRPNDTNMAFFITTAETAIDRFTKLQGAYKEQIARLSKSK